MEGIELRTFLIDTVEQVPNSDAPLTYDGGVQMVTYSVVASDAREAFERFSEDPNAGVEFYRGDTVNFIIIGIQEKKQ